MQIKETTKTRNNFRRSLNMPMNNYEVYLTLTWSEKCVLTDFTIQAARAAQGDNPARSTINAPTNAIF